MSEYIGAYTIEDEKGRVSVHTTPVIYTSQGDEEARRKRNKILEDIQKQNPSKKVQSSGFLLQIA